MLLDTLNLLEVMKQHSVKNFIFSSSATGDPEILPIIEISKRSCTNPYFQRKLTVEYILEDLAKSDSQWNIISVRYFNLIGAHELGMIDEDPNDIPNALYQPSSGCKLERLSIFGDDYDTVDGIGVRDDIHVVDLAKGYVSALDYITKQQTTISFEPINLGTGTETSVLQLVNAFVENTNQQVPYVIAHRRSVDIASFYTSVDKAKELLNWQAKLTIDDMCRDTWKWQRGNPEGCFL